QVCFFYAFTSHHHDMKFVVIFVRFVFGFLEQEENMVMENVNRHTIASNLMPFGLILFISLGGFEVCFVICNIMT
ncbi:MAG: hypothetical protein KDD36_13875, partial [Flavobacteriales bacterium]|nr:hypothetical protein [Flavobacteriales bacterium]